MVYIGAEKIKSYFIFMMVMGKLLFLIHLLQLPVLIYKSDSILMKKFLIGIDFYLYIYYTTDITIKQMLNC